MGHHSKSILDFTARERERVSYILMMMLAMKSLSPRIILPAIATSSIFITKRFLRKAPYRKLPVPKFEKRLDVAILGHVNVGKSVLLNTLIEDKIAATSRKRHTTRFEILGVFNHRNVQLVFYDTPGYLKKSASMKNDTKKLRDVAEATVGKADVVLLVVDASLPLTDTYKDAFTDMARLAISNAKIEIVLVLNKVDLVNPKTQLLNLTYELVSLINYVKLGPEKAHLATLDTTTFMISAMQDDGVIDLKNYLISIAEVKPWVIPRGKGSTALTMEQRVEQIVLEMLLDNCHDELPYIADISCISIVPMTLTRMQIDVTIKVDTSAQQRILLGHQGRTMVKVRQSAVEVLEKIVKKQVILYLWIRLRGDKEGAGGGGGLGYTKPSLGH